MKAIFKKELVLLLIKDDLINSKLVNGLNELGLDADCYCLNIGSTVFRLMGINTGIENEDVWDSYHCKYPYYPTDLTSTN